MKIKKDKIRRLIKELSTTSRDRERNINAAERMSESKLKITKGDLKRIIKEEYSKLLSEYESGRGHLSMVHSKAKENERKDQEMGYPGSKTSFDWLDFGDMSDPAEAMDWMFRNNIPEDKRDELLELWNVEASEIEYEEALRGRI